MERHVPVLVVPPPPSLLVSQVTWFHMDCQDLMTQLRLGKAQRAAGMESDPHRKEVPGRNPVSFRDQYPEAEGRTWQEGFGGRDPTP